MRPRGAQLTRHSPTLLVLGSRPCHTQERPVQTQEHDAEGILARPRRSPLTGERVREPRPVEIRVCENTYSTGGSRSHARFERERVVLLGGRPVHFERHTHTSSAERLAASVKASAVHTYTLSALSEHTFFPFEHTRREMFRSRGRNISGDAVDCPPPRERESSRRRTPMQAEPAKAGRTDGRLESRPHTHSELGGVRRARESSLTRTD